ncbi:dynein assembly factor with WDR repeat domains 1-like [Hemicordylus capensis]|uniref:dynein assembly factor with WDR repeat domains 1-like n=1 Tax=Hemicordylus capensis TaxID=884348 RepID=UPI002302B9C5|nr:dynein assembly factor with WDR repeat domains 1-like [Hemicordylus capensis]
MQPAARRGHVTTAGPSTTQQATVTASPSISGDLRLLHTIDCGDQLLCCQFNNDGTRVCAGACDGTIKVFSVSDGSLHHVLADNDTRKLGLPTTSMRFLPRGPAHNADVLLVTYSGGMVKLWHVPSHTCVRTMKEDRQTMICCFNPSGSKFITGGSGPGIYMYDAQTWDKLGIFEPSDSTNVMDGHMSRVYALTFFPENDDRFVSGGWDNTVQFWTMQSKHSLRRLSGPHICGDAISIDKTGAQVLTGSWRRSNTLEIWDAETGAKLIDIPEDFRGQSQIYTCHFLGLDHIVAGGSRNNTCRLIDRRILMSTGALNDLPGGVYSTHINARGILSATSSTNLYLAQTPARP